MHATCEGCEAQTTYWIDLKEFRGCGIGYATAGPPTERRPAEECPKPETLDAWFAAPRKYPSGEGATTFG